MTLVEPYLAATIESANFSWMFISLIGAFYTWKWQRKGLLTWHTSQIVTAWTWVFLASGLNHGWFAISRHTAEVGFTWNQTMFEHRWVLVITTACMFGWGMFKFIRLIEQFSLGRKLGILGLIAILSFLVGFM